MTQKHDAPPAKEARLRPAPTALRAAESAARRHGGAVHGHAAAVPPHGPVGPDGTPMPDPTARNAPHTRYRDDQGIADYPVNTEGPAQRPDAEGRGRPEAVAKPLPRG